MIGWFRHAEIKHGRVAMFAFVGYCVQANGIHFPWNLQGPIGPLNAGIPTISYADILGGGRPVRPVGCAADGCQAADPLLRRPARVLERVEVCARRGGRDALRARRQARRLPLVQEVGPHPHPVPLDYFNPIGTVDKMSAEEKATKLRAELNNSRFAMIGIIGLISASKGLIVPGIDAFPQPQYAGEPMAYFSSVNTDLPMVADMLNAHFPWMN